MMKNKKKRKAAIVAALVFSMSIVVWLIIRLKRKTATGVISRLKLSDEIKKALLQQVKNIEEYAVNNPTGDEVWTKARIEADAKALGISTGQMVVIHAAYQLIAQGLINQEKYAEIKSNIITM